MQEKDNIYQPQDEKPPSWLSSWLCNDLSGKLGLLSRMHLVLSTGVLVLRRTRKRPLCFLLGAQGSFSWS